MATCDRSGVTTLDCGLTGCHSVKPCLERNLHSKGLFTLGFSDIYFGATLLMYEEIYRQLI